MGKIDLWSLITGVASIASIMLAMWDKFPILKKYLLPLGYVLLGFTLGRVSFIGGSVTNAIISDSQVSGSLIIIISLIMLCLFCFHFLMKKGNEMMGYMIVVIVLSMIAPSLLTSFSKVSEKMSPKDYLSLASTYEKSSDYEGAIKYLDKYSEAISDKQLQEQVKNKISMLRQKQLNDLK